MSDKLENFAMKISLHASDFRILCFNNFLLASITNLKTILGYSYMLTKLNFELKRSRDEEAALEHCVYIMSAIGSKERRSRFFNDSYIL